MRLFRVFFGLLPFTTYAFGSFTAQCFTTKFNHGISNSEPVAELFELTLNDCLNYCILNAAKAGDGCASVVFHREYSTCQLYGHDGYYKGSQIVPANNHDYYNRTSYIGACQDRVAPKRGYQQRPGQYSAQSAVISPFPKIQQEIKHKKKKSSRHKKLTTPATTPAPRPTVDPSYFRELVDQEIEKPAARTKIFYNPAKTNVCSKTEVISYFVLFGESLSAAVRPARLRGVDQSSCIMYCSQNINASGAAFPCYAANYDPGLEECRLYGRDAKQDRHSARLAADDNIIFADKFCIQTSKDCSADSPYIVYLHKQITQKIVAHFPDVHSIVACMALCIDNGACKATTFKKGGLCILHSVSPENERSVLIDGSEATMVVENGCQTSARAVPSLLAGAMEGMPAGSASQETAAGEWSDWSACQFGPPTARMRSRTRECYSDDCQDLEMQPCRPH